MLSVANNPYMCPHAECYYAECRGTIYYYCQLPQSKIVGKAGAYQSETSYVNPLLARLRILAKIFDYV